jgi:hypothetical protein
MNVSNNQEISFDQSDMEYSRKMKQLANHAEMASKITNWTALSENCNLEGSRSIKERPSATERLSYSTTSNAKSQENSQINNATKVNQSDMEYRKDIQQLAKHAEMASKITNWTAISEKCNFEGTESTIEADFATDLDTTISGLKKSNRDATKKTQPAENHKAKKLNRCPICPDKFERYRDLVVHFRTHKSLKKFSCDHCSEEFFSKTGFRKHLEKHEESRQNLTKKAHICVVDGCGKSFQTQQYLKKHQQVHQKSSGSIA